MPVRPGWHFLFFCNTATTQATPIFVKLDELVAEMLWMELLEGEPDKLGSYTEVECVFMTLRGLGFDDDEALVGLVLMGQGFTLDKTIQYLTSETSMADLNVSVDCWSGERGLQSTENLSQGVLRKLSMIFDLPYMDVTATSNC